ncbi:hypothetical protein ABZ319_11095 [Nocardia sp. NPDC005978]|uniref:hypothetical protein n=1 Tax=Nocardia sp. NPDC005978 TaxID=3156725 RepID=UPI0033B453FB
MGFIARQNGSPSAGASKRSKAAALMLLGLASLSAVVVAILVLVWSRFAGLADSLIVPEVVKTNLTDSDARDKMAREFHIHIPDNWRLISMTSTCEGDAIKSCAFNGSFTGPPSEFERYPTLFRARPPQTVDQPAARPVTCAELTERNLTELASGIDCAIRQELVLSDLTGRGNTGFRGNVLVAGTATETIVRISAWTA